MSKPMSDARFRKINVDNFDQDKYDDPEEADTPGLGPDENEVNGLLQQNRLQDALKAAIKSPPLKTKNQNMKDKAGQLMARVLTSFKQSDIAKAVDSLDREELDLLMKYIYKGFQCQQDAATCASLLAWHEKVHDKAGAGAIVRVFTDRKRFPLKSND